MMPEPMSLQARIALAAGHVEQLRAYGPPGSRWERDQLRAAEDELRRLRAEQARERLAGGQR